MPTLKHFSCSAKSPYQGLMLKHLIKLPKPQSMDKQPWESKPVRSLIYQSISGTKASVCSQLIPANADLCPSQGCLPLSLLKTTWGGDASAARCSCQGILPQNTD